MINAFPRRAIGFLALAASLLAPPLRAQAPDAGATVVEVRDGDTIALSDGRLVRLAGIAAPKAIADTSGRPRRDRTLDALATEATAALRGLTRDGAVTLVAQPGTDRHGRTIADVFAAGRPLQLDLIGRGLARVEGPPVESGAVAAWLAREAEARAAGRGLWTHAAFLVRSADEAGRHVESFQIVEGTVTTIRDGRSASFIVFETTGNRSFAASAGGRVRTALRRAEGGLNALVGATIRVRGWVRWQNGPLIEIQHAAFVERVD